MIDTFYLVGSGLNAIQISEIKKVDGTLFGAINNTASIDVDFDFSFRASDFKEAENISIDKLQNVIIPAAEVNDKHISFFGPRAFRGATTSIAVTYWLLRVIKPKNIIYLGCDMNYIPTPDGKTHFYGTGTADPLRENVSLKNLTAKLTRLWYFSTISNINLYRYPVNYHSRLPYPETNQVNYRPQFDKDLVQKAMDIERSILPDVKDNNFQRIEKDTKLVNLLAEIDNYWELSIFSE